ncbi:hypothetical protein C8R45DRAFT_527856 [Mycena sanguinolenta]|nr:hypothetical protein C8R45DRAFT_527856 [Mycena sanguinolenta]
MAQQTVRTAAQSFRSVHSSAVRAAAAVDVPMAVLLPPMFDIFDVPVELRRTRSTSASKHAPRAARPRPFSPSSHTLNPRTQTSLPHPLVFEGPAGRRPVVRRHHETTVAAYAPQHGSEPVVTLFDGPAHSGGRKQRPSGSAHAQSAKPADGRPFHLAMGAVAATALTLGVAHS